jgi:anti-sigma regulatory factor (Ser/Thr protein kinase)
MKEKVKTIVVQTPGDISYLYRIREFIAGIAIEAGIDQQDIDNIELAVDEACTNVLEHGYAPDDPNKELTIRLEINTSKLVLTVIDHAKPFNLLLYQPRNVTELKAEGKNGGLGIRLIMHIMDTIDYKTRPDGYNELIMTKYFTSVKQDKELNS